MCIAGGKIIDLSRHLVAQQQAADASPRTVRQFAAHDHLCFEGDPRTHVFVVESGWVKIYRTLVDGQRQVVGFANAGSVLGLESGGEHLNSCEAVTPVSVRPIAVSRLNDMCARDPAFAQQVIAQLGRQLGAAQAQLATVGAQSAEQKLATFLLTIADLSSAAPGEAFDLPMRRGDMAEFLGLRLETVSRKMTEFQRRRWISMTSLYHCVILRRDTLEQLAVGGEADDVHPRRAG